MNEIKSLYEKAAEEMKENLNNQNLAQNIEEKLLIDEQFQKQLLEEQKFESTPKQREEQ